MPRKKSKLAALSERIAHARHIIHEKQVLLAQLRHAQAPTRDAEAALRTYASSLTHLLAHEHKLKEEAEAKKGERKQPRELATKNRSLK